MDYVLFQKDQGYSFDVPIDHIRFLKDFDVNVKAEEKENIKTAEIWEYAKQFTVLIYWEEDLFVKYKSQFLEC